MARWDYSMAFLFQHAAWTTLQFWRLRIAVMIASSFLEHVLHSTLPPVAMAAIAHTFKKYCGGGGEGSSDFAALVAPYVFDFYLLMGCGWSSRRPRSLAPGGAAGGVPRGWCEDCSSFQQY